MSDLVLSFAMTPYDRVMPLITGEVKPAGITLEYQGMPGAVPGVFYDQIKFHRYDVSEFSFSSFLVDRPKGLPYRMLPVFHNRNFSYTRVVIRKASGIRQDHPEDLRGKRLAVMDYQQTAALWIRGVLLHEWGLKPEDIIWYQTRGQNYSHTGSSGTQLPPGVQLHYATAGFGDLLLRGEVDAAMGWGAPTESSLDRKSVSVKGNPDFCTLFADPMAEGIRYFKKNGVYPPHHTTIVRDSILEKHPWVATSLMDAFQRAKEVAARRLRETPPTMMVFGHELLDQVEAAFGPDPFPYGVRANAKAIDFVQTISLEQGLTAKKQPLEELFAPEVLISEERL